MKTRKDYNSIDWASLFSYDPDTGNLYNRLKGKGKRTGPIGGINSQGYISVCYNGKKWLGHRVAYVIFHGSIDQRHDIDHIDQNKLNNRIDNIRAVDRATNNRNSGLRADNTHGAKGICFHSDRKSCWSATMFVGGKKKGLGYFEDKQDAIAARKEAKIKYKFTADAVGG